jgi:MoxR-like ATPase
MEFTGSKNYISTNDLTVAVNASIALEKPLLVKGEPGTGKTELARQIASSLKLQIIEWSIKSTTKAQQGLYEYDAVSRLRDSQLGEEIKNISKYIKKGKIWESFETTKKSVLLIDEIDKADIEFPNDLLQELDKMEFYIYETGKVIKANHRPIIIITSNNEKELPEAFLRRCFFHYIQFPEIDTLRKIIEVHFPDIKKSLLETALKKFFQIREVPGLKKKPSTSEALDWIKLLLVEDLDSKDLKSDGKNILPKLHGALLKNEQDIQLFEQLAFMSRRED